MICGADVSDDAEAKQRVRWWTAVLGTTAIVAASGAVVVLTQSSSDPARLRARAQTALASKDYDQALAALDRSARLGPPSPADWLIRAQVAIERNRPKEALDALEHVSDTVPESIQARLWEIYVDLYQNRARAAEAAILRLLKLDPKQVKPRRDLIEIYANQGRWAELDAQYRALAAHAALDFDDLFQWCHAGALDREPEVRAQALEAYVRADPADRASRLALAEILRRMGKLNESESILSPLSETDAGARLVRARLARDRGDAHAAEALLEPFSDSEPGVTALRGLLALERSDGATAANQFRKALEHDPANRDALFGLGQALRLTGDRASADRYLRDAWSHDRFMVSLEHASPPSARQDAKVLRSLGTACEGLGRMAQALGWYQLAIAHDPLDPENHQAIARVQKATAKGPTRP
jgi:tetratricopeptide (TPR) repeat protein